MAPDQDPFPLTDPTPSKEDIQAVLDDLADLAPGPAITHHFGCWQWHIGCLAERIRSRLSPQ